MSILHLKQNDTRPSGTLSLKEPAAPGETPDPYDLTGAVKVWMHITLSDGTVIPPKAMAIIDVANGVVRRDWVADDWITNPLVPTPTDAGQPRGPNHHTFEIEVVYSATDRVTFPNDDWQQKDKYVLLISPHIADGNP